MSYLRTLGNNEFWRKINFRKFRKDVFQELFNFTVVFEVLLTKNFSAFFILVSSFFLFLLTCDIFKVNFQEITLEINPDRFITLDDTIETSILYPNIFWEFFARFYFHNSPFHVCFREQFFANLAEIC